MSEATGDKDTGNGEPDAAPTPPKDATPAASTKSQNMIPQSRVNEITAEKNAALKKLEEIQTWKADQEAKAAQKTRKKLEDNAEHEKIAIALQLELDGLKDVKARAKKAETALATQLKKARANVPDHLLPLLDPMDAADQLDYLAEHGEALMPPTEKKKTVTNMNATDGGTGGDDKSDEASIRTRFGLPPAPE